MKTKNCFRLPGASLGLLLVSILLSGCGGSGSDGADVIEGEIAAAPDSVDDSVDDIAQRADDDTAQRVDVDMDVAADTTAGADETDDDTIVDPEDTTPVEMTVWGKTFGDGGEDYAFSVQQTNSGGYAVAGCSDTWAGEPGFLLLSLDADGVEQWHASYGGGNMDCARAVRQTADGGYVLAGYSNGSGTGGVIEMLIVKTDAAGNKEWQKFIGGDEDHEARSVRPCSDGGYIVTGYYFSVEDVSYNAMVVKLDANGDEVWTRTLGGGGHDYGHDIIETSDGGYLMAGNNGGSGMQDVWLVKLDAAGVEKWSQTFGGPPNDYGHAVVETADGGYMVVGETYSFGTDLECDIWLIKTDSSGTELWSQTYGDDAMHEYGFAVHQAHDGGFVVAGSRASYEEQTVDALLLRTDADGDEVWMQVMDGGAAEGFYSVQQTTDHGFVVGGYTQSWGAGAEDAWVVKTNASGSISEPQ